MGRGGHQTSFAHICASAMEGLPVAPGARAAGPTHRKPLLTSGKKRGDRQAQPWVGGQVGMGPGLLGT